MQQKGIARVNTFVGGFVSDASPLTFPENTSKVDINMRLSANGSRQRAFGIDFEDNYIEIDSNVVLDLEKETVTSSFRWENVSGDPEKNILCTQIGNKVSFFDFDKVSISRGLIGERVFSDAPTTSKFSFTSVDGLLVIADGTNLITIVTYNQNNTLSYRVDTIRVRDFFGVEDKVSGQDITNGLGLIVRPTSLSEAHAYNLRNQSFAIPRINGSDESTIDPIQAFRNASGAGYPSNADTVTAHLYPDANDEQDRLSYRYFARDSVQNPLGSMRAPQGYFIIDLLNRGPSRLSESSRNQNNYPSLGFPISSIPADVTPGGATVVGEFAGRVWFGGFSGEVVNGDEKSPRLSSYIAFSRLVTNPTDITQCYQEGDPTTSESPDIIATDGGFIRISNAFGIKAMVNLGSDLLVGAANGWWRVSGGDNNGFSATDYMVSKITDRGIRGHSSVVEAEGALFYWADDGIYGLSKNQLGDWEAQSITQNRIQTFYDSIPIEDKDTCFGTYDSFQKTVRWLYQNRLSERRQQKELVFSINLNAFYERHISNIGVSSLPITVANFRSNSFKLNEVVSIVTVDGEDVKVNGALVTNTIEARVGDVSLYESGYLTITQLTPTIKYTFSSYTDLEFTDWKSVDGIGVDAPSTLITGTSSGGDEIRFKQVPYIVTQMKRTEDGFDIDGDENWTPRNQSSCFLQGHWDWTGSMNSNKWTKPFQIYRYTRHYFPTSSESYDTGYDMIVTKNKIFGRGRSVALKFVSEPKKEMHIYGWSMVLGMNQNV
jgi:hypothetical protein